MTKTLCLFTYIHNYNPSMSKERKADTLKYIPQFIIHNCITPTRKKFQSISVSRIYLLMKIMNPTRIAKSISNYIYPIFGLLVCLFQLIALSPIPKLLLITIFIFRELFSTFKVDMQKKFYHKNLSVLSLLTFNLCKNRS